jgi:hypothetical protein
MFMPVIFVVCGDVAGDLQICRATSPVAGSATDVETGDCEDHLQELRFDDLQVESPRRGQVDKSFVNRGTRNLSKCPKRKKCDLIRCQIGDGLKLWTQEYASLLHMRSRNFVKSDRQE